jgi:two-component sensor histidine kinase
MRSRAASRNELNHRVKNTLATVQSIAAQTLRASALEEVARHAFDARLIALSNAHNLLMQENWAGATLSEVVKTALGPRDTPDDTRFKVMAGPDIRLSPKTALAVAMALHELSTNALKYGALSAPRGCVDLSWEARGEGEVARFLMEWRERGGPPVRAPGKPGFGTRLVERGLAAELGGTVRLAYERKGLVCTIEAPLPRVGEGEESLAR